MVRPTLDDILELSLPDGVEVRPVVADDLRAIWEAQADAVSGSFGEQEPTEADWLEFRDDPIADPTLWKIAWAGDRVVGQVRSYINHQENALLGRLRGYTERISTHADWRGRGLASALLALSLREVRARGMAEAALGVDTANPANAVAIYARLGFRLTAYTAVLDKPLTP
jgi:ribosomal protein S18 acetylase RimI-like enzyme